METPEQVLSAGGELCVRLLKAIEDRQLQWTPVVSQDAGFRGGFQTVGAGLAATVLAFGEDDRVGYDGACSDLSKGLVLHFPPEVAARVYSMVLAQQQ